jgi:hypothetical protein
MFTELALYFVNMSSALLMGGGNTDCRQHSCTEGYKRKERNVKTSSNLHHFLRGQQQRLQKRCRWASTDLRTVKHNSYRSMNCVNKLSKDIFQGRTKAEVIVRKVLVPRSVQDFINVSKDPAKPSNFFFVQNFPPLSFLVDRRHPHMAIPSFLSATNSGCPASVR